MKISQKIIMGIIIVIGLTAIAGYICIRINKKVLENNIKAYSATQAVATLDAIDLKIQSRIEQVEAFAVHLSQEPEMREYNNSFKEISDPNTFIQQNDQQWQSDFQKGQTNDLMTKIQNSHTSLQLINKFEQKEFYKEKYGYPIWGEAFITNQYGVNIAQCHVTSDYYQADEAWWNAAKDNGLYISDIEYDDSASIYSIAICKRINDQAGNFLGILKTVLNIREALNILENAKKNSLFKTLDFKLIARNGEFINISEETLQKPNPIIQQHISNFIKNFSSDIFDIDGKTMYVFTHSKGNENFAGLGWTLVVEYEISEVFASVIKLKNYLLTLLFVVSGLSITIAGLFVHRYVSIPIKKLIDATNKIGNGDLNTQVTVTSNDELGTLSQSFNTMAINLQKIDALENQRDQEIAARKGLEKKLWDSRELFEAFMSSTIFAISIIDKNHKIIRVNPLYAELFQKPVESFVGKYCHQESEKSEYICSHCPGTKAMISGKTEVAETQGVRDDGSYFDARICAVPFYNSDNELAGFIEMIENTTKMKQDEARLIESEEKYRKQFEGALDAIFLADIETGILIDCNQAALKLVGREKTEIIGQHQRILHTSDALDSKFTKEFEEHLICDEEKVIETKVITRDGENKDVAIKACVIEINGKKVLQGIFRDITENKQKERELQKIQEELIEASRRAGMAEVAADVLHNVGNVLNSINVTTTLIKDTLSKSEIPNLKIVTDMIEGQLGNLDKFFKDDPKGKHIPSYLKEVVQLLTQEQEDIVNKLKTLIEDINHIKTIINMQQEYTKVLGAEVTITIDQVIESAIRINQASLKRHNIRFVKECTDFGEVTINKNSIIQILVNLIANAKNALLESDVVDKVLTIRSYKQDNQHLRIEITDNGVGISWENLTKLFKHGFTTRKDGHGFGLHSSAIAAKDMNGSLTAHSEGLGHGATFTLELPLKLANACWIDDKPIMIS